MKAAKESLRWLGVYFDRKLTFTNHVVQWTEKAGRVVNHLRGICNTSRGMPVSSVRRAVQTCVLPVLTYGLEAWYPGETRTSRTGVKINCGVQTHLRRMDAVLRNAARAILPVYKTTPAHILNFEAQLPPARLLAEAIRRRHGFRLGKLDSRHPLARRLALQLRKEPTRLQRCYQLVPDFPRPVIPKLRYTKPPSRLDKEKEAEAFKLWLQQRNASRDLVIYSDGSQIRHDGELRTGWGFSIREGGTSREVYTKAGRLLQAEVFDAEVYAALQGLAAR